MTTHDDIDSRRSDHIAAAILDEYPELDHEPFPIVRRIALNHHEAYSSASPAAVPAPSDRPTLVDPFDDDEARMLAASGKLHRGAP
jgi:hypothetical protein